MKKLVECTKTQYSSIEIDGNTDENIPNDIRLLQTRDIFTTSRTFRMWLNERRYTFFRYMLCYLFITTMFISIDKTTNIKIWITTKQVILFGKNNINLLKE